MRVRLLYFSVRKGQVRLRFEFELCEDQRDCAEPAFEATFVCRMASRPLFSTSVERSANAEYSLAESLSKELADEWLGLKVTDEMPFRLVLRPLESGG